MRYFNIKNQKFTNDFDIVSQTTKNLNESLSLHEKAPVITPKQRGAWLSMNLKTIIGNKKALFTQLSLRGKQKQIDTVAKPLKLKLPKLDLKCNKNDSNHYK